MRDEAYWLGLVERFFAAQTSETEEKELREFLLSSRDADARYDEVRAVMSLLAEMFTGAIRQHLFAPWRCLSVETFAPQQGRCGGGRMPSIGPLRLLQLPFSACVRSTWGPTGRVPFAMPTSAERKPQTLTS